VLSTDAELGALYLAAMELAGDYAYAGREYVIGEVLQILGSPSVTMSVHNHHNYAWFENGAWVVRKGATPLTEEPAFIGGSMGDISVIVKGTGEEIGALGSAPHGAGRVMSRTKAAGKVRKRKRYGCPERDCPVELSPQEFDVLARKTESGPPLCSDHRRPLKRFWKSERLSEGVIDWPAVRVELAARGIHVVGAGADEAPGVYKDLATVIGLHGNIEIVHLLRPLGVVMAGPEVEDPWKD
jgi:tRNA-splicing ligase RtcB